MKVGFIGLGIMGEPMCYNIIRKHDDEVYIFDVNPERILLVEKQGGIPCTCSREVGEKADVIITMVPRSEHSLSVYKELKEVMDDTKICIDMSTIDPGVSLEIYQMLKACGTPFLDAPVVKSQAAARLGNIGIYVGGDYEVYQSVKPILKYMGRSIIHMGEHGKGLVMKICHNAVTAQVQNAVNETLNLAVSQGIDMDRYGAALSYGNAQNSYFDTKQAAIKNRDYTTAFSVENMEKDINICLNFANQHNFRMKGLEVVRNIYETAMEKGMGAIDFSSTIEVVAEDMKKNDRN